MPIVNLDNVINNPSLNRINGNQFSLRVESDNVATSTMFTTHTIKVDNFISELYIGQVIEVNGYKGEITSLQSEPHIKNFVITARFAASSTLPFTANTPVSIFEYFEHISTTQYTDDSITYNVQNNMGLYLYFDYTAGIETDIRMYFTIRDIKQDSLKLQNSEYALMTVTDPTGANIPYNLKLTTTGLYTMPVTIPEPSKYLTINFGYTGATPATGGVLKVFANTDRNYYAQ